MSPRRKREGGREGGKGRKGNRRERGELKKMVKNIYIDLHRLLDETSQLPWMD